MWYILSNSIKIRQAIFVQYAPHVNIINHAFTQKYISWNGQFLDDLSAEEGEL